jgi:hypothetical protein
MTRSGGTLIVPRHLTPAESTRQTGSATGKSPEDPQELDFLPRKTSPSGLVIVLPRKIGVTAFGSAVPDPQRMSRGFTTC